VVDTVQELEVAAVVEGAAVCLSFSTTSPPLRRPVAAERIDDDVAADRLAPIERNTTCLRDAAVGDDEPGDPRGRTQLDCRLLRSSTA
jgi:hypothetical protein